MAEKATKQGNWRGIKYKVKFYKRYRAKCFARYTTSFNIVKGKFFPDIKKMMKQEKGRKDNYLDFMHGWFVKMMDFALKEMIDKDQAMVLPFGNAIFVSDRDDLHEKQKEDATGNMGQRYKTTFVLRTPPDNDIGVYWDIYLMKKYRKRIKENVKKGKMYR
jgi:hypothetical protein